MPTSSGDLLEIQELNMRYPNSAGWTLDGLNLKMNPGQRLALIGTSGCGKSTVARVILQLIPPGCLIEGGLLLTGKDPRRLNQSKLQGLRGTKVGLVFQDPMTRLNPLMTAGGHLLDTLQAHLPETTSTWRRRRAEELLERVGINPARFSAFPHEFSGGMRQRLAIALAIALEPPLVIADEPTTSLDVAVADQVMAELSSLCVDLGSALLLITHDLAMASRWCEEVAILDQGRIVEKGSSKKLLQRPKSLIGRRFVSAALAKEAGRSISEPFHEVVLEVSRLRCWHAISGWPWQSNWIKAVDEVSFCIHAGETLGVVGSSGCGKSTLCRALMGLTSVRGGEVKLCGQNIFLMSRKELRKARQSLQMVFQDPFASLNPKMRIGEAIADPLLIHNVCSSAQARDKARELLEQVGLIAPEDFENRLPSELSGGQQQRVAIARALALNPKVLICDESLSMLDVEVQSDVLALLRSLQKQLGLAILFITHDLSLATGLCHRVIVLDQGRIVEEGSGKKILSSPQAALTRKLVAACPRLSSIS